MPVTITTDNIARRTSRSRRSFPTVPVVPGGLSDAFGPLVSAVKRLAESRGALGAARAELRSAEAAARGAKAADAQALADAIIGGRSDPGAVHATQAARRLEEAERQDQGRIRAAAAMQDALDALLDAEHERLTGELGPTIAAAREDARDALDAFLARRARLDELVAFRGFLAGQKAFGLRTFANAGLNADSIVRLLRRELEAEPEQTAEGDGLAEEEEDEGA